MVTSYEKILPSLTQFISEKGVEQFNHITSFLLEAADRDLNATHPSTQTDKLSAILAEFQGVKVFNTMKDWIHQASLRFFPQMKKNSNFLDKNKTSDKAITIY